MDCSGVKLDELHQEVVTGHEVCEEFVLMPLRPLEQFLVIGDHSIDGEVSCRFQQVQIMTVWEVLVDG